MVNFTTHWVCFAILWVDCSIILLGRLTDTTKKYCPHEKWTHEKSPNVRNFTWLVAPRNIIYVKSDPFEWESYIKWGQWNNVHCRGKGERRGRYFRSHKSMGMLIHRMFFSRNINQCGKNCVDVKTLLTFRMVNKLWGCYLRVRALNNGMLVLTYNNVFVEF